jgi:hypothetical protein
MMRSRRSIEIRRIRVWLSVSAAIALVPWIVYLALSLPEDYVAQDWRATWVGFDILLLSFLIATAVFGFLRHQLLTLVAFTTGVLLICDAWFDVMTARRADMVVSVLSAALAELPLAAILIGGTLRIVQLNQSPFSREGYVSRVLEIASSAFGGWVTRAKNLSIRRPAGGSLQR